MWRMDGYKYQINSIVHINICSFYIKLMCQKNMKTHIPLS